MRNPKTTSCSEAALSRPVVLVGDRRACRREMRAEFGLAWKSGRTVCLQGSYSPVRDRTAAVFQQFPVQLTGIARRRGAPSVTKNPQIGT